MITLSHKNYSFIDIFFPFIIILAPYSILGFKQIILTILFCYAIYCVCTNRCKMYVHKYLFFFIITYTFIQLLNIFRHPWLPFFTNMNNFIMPWFILFIISTIAYKINKTNLYRIYSIVGFVVATTLYLQSIGLLIFNIPARPINLLPVSADDFHFWNYFRGERPSAFFPEPQAYASFMLPLLFLTLNRRKFIYSTFIGGSIFFSTSSQGILLVIILLIFMFVIHPNKWYLKIAYIAFIIIIVGAFLVLPVFNFAYEKIIKIFNPELLKDNIRLVRGYLIYSTFNANDLLLGIGDGNQQMYVENNLYLFWDWAKAHISDNEQLMGYSTTIARILIAVGPLPLLFFIQMIYKMYKYDDKIMRPLLIIILFSSFAQTLLFNSWFFFYYLFYIGYCDKEKYGENFYIFKIKS